MPLKITFQGEYKIADGEWKNYSQQTYIPANKGDVYLKGFFQIESDGGQIIGKANKDTCIMAYLDHIGGYINVNGKINGMFDTENNQLGASSCGELWITFYCPAGENDEKEIVHNFRTMTDEKSESFLKLSKLLNK